jgi:ABC-type oligopeptide transport system ATPase subunit
LIFNPPFGDRTMRETWTFHSAAKIVFGRNAVDQLGEMAKKLKEAANMEERKKQLDQALKNGGLSKEQYEREVDKLSTIISREEHDANQM